MTTPPPPEVCKFPVEIDEVGEIVKHGIDLDGGGSRPGRRGDYCEQLVTDPDGVARQHTRTIAFARRRELQAAGIGNGQVKPGRSVSAARGSLAELVAQFELVSAAHRDQISALVERAAQIVTIAGDPDSAAAE